MCRFLVFKGKEPILLSNLILDPAHSILTQSYDTRLRMDLGQNNGDGFGIGYYALQSLKHLLGPQPCVFTSIIPAWNCTNLARLASKTISPLIFAHVRASTEAPLADVNCHPWSRGSLMWMHNGSIGNWKDGVKRRLTADLEDRWFTMVTGGTDSEWAFACYLDTLDKMGYDPDDEESQAKGFGQTVLRKAMLRTIERINAYIRPVRQPHDNPSTLNFAVSDGQSVVCTRYTSSRTQEPVSLFFSSGTNWHRQGVNGEDRRNKGKSEWGLERRDRGADIILVASEPLTFDRDNWVTVPPNSTVTIHGQTVLIHPVIDEFHRGPPASGQSSSQAEETRQKTGIADIVPSGSVAGIVTPPTRLGTASAA